MKIYIKIIFLSITILLSYINIGATECDDFIKLGDISQSFNSDTTPNGWILAGYYHNLIYEDYVETGLGHYGVFGDCGYMLYNQR